MNDPVELLLRDVLAEEAEGAPSGGNLVLGARRRLRRRLVTRGVAAAFVLVVAGTVAAVLPGRDRAALAPADSGALTGTDWQLVEYTRGGVTVDMREVDARLSFSEEGTYAGVVCNHIGGTADIDGDRVTLAPGFTTRAACPPPEDQAQRDFGAFTAGPLRWRVTDGALWLTTQNGDHFLFRVRESGYPDPSAKTIAEGRHDRMQYRLAYRDGRILVVDARRGPGYGWTGESMAEDRAHPLSWALRVPLDRSTRYVAGWATKDTAVVWHQARGGARTELTIYPVDGKKVFGGIVAANPKGSTIRLHRADGSVIATFTENRPE